MNDQSGELSVPRTMIATKRKKMKVTSVFHDELPPLKQGEIRMSIDKVGLSTNNVFYAQMGEAPFLKFYSVYPIPGQQEWANVPAWGIGTVTASRHSEFQIGDRFRGFLHMGNVVQMQAKRKAEGFVAKGGHRDKLNKAYNAFTAVPRSVDSPFFGDDAKADLAMVAAPGALSAHIIYELLKMKNFFQGNSVVLTSASSKISLATALVLARERDVGRLQQVIAYTSAKNRSWVEQTGVYDEVLTYDQTLSPAGKLDHVMIDVAGDGSLYKQNKQHLVKALAVGGTHSKAKSSTFTAFGPSAIVKMAANMAAPRVIRNWVDNQLNPKLEMFFAPTVMAELARKMGRSALDKRCEETLAVFVDAAVSNDWIQVTRCEDAESAQAAYQRIFRGEVPPSEAIIVSLKNG